MTTTGDLPIERLKAAYTIGEWETVRLLPGGKSQHYHLRTDQGEYVLRRSYASKELAAISFEHDLIAHLRCSGFPAPQVVANVDGETSTALDGRRYRLTVFVPGTPYQADNRRHLRASAQALARYHQIVASFEPPATGAGEPFLNDVLRQRLAAKPDAAAITAFLTIYADQQPHLPTLLGELPYALEQGERVLQALDRLYPRLPLITIHGGCRRGSTLFKGDDLHVMLDFDSARWEARVLDLAIALHDFGKIFGQRGSPDFKVPLNLEIVAQFMSAYLDINPLEPAEREALPFLLAARPLKRALGKYQSMIEEEVVSPGHVRKTAQEIARVHWLETHAQALDAALGGTVPEAARSTANKEDQNEHNADFAARASSAGASRQPVLDH